MLNLGLTVIMRSLLITRFAWERAVVRNEWHLFWHHGSVVSMVISGSVGVLSCGILSVRVLAWGHWSDWLGCFHYRFRYRFRRKRIRRH